MVEAAAPKLSAKKVTLLKGKTKTLKLKSAKGKIKWSTSNKQVATVSSKGKVTAKKAGTAIITATNKSKKYKCTVTVESPRLSATKLTIQKGGSATLKLTGTKQKIKWSTSKKSVLTVTSKGRVTGKKTGTATVTATVAGKKYTCKVTVKKASKVPPAVSTPVFEVSATSLKISKTGSVQITYNQSGNILYKVADANIITCKFADNWAGDTATLNITALRAGTTTITVSNTTSSKKYVITVTVDYGFNVSLPKTPVTINSYSSSNQLTGSCMISDVSFSIQPNGNRFYFELLISGQKTYTNLGGTLSSSIPVGWKLYKGGTVVQSGTIYTPKLADDESFSGAYATGFLNSPGNYQVVLEGVK